MPPLLRDALLLLLGAALAAAAEEWRDRRAHSRRAALVRETVTAELRRNAAAVERSHRHHLEMIDTLTSYRARHAPVPARIYLGAGIFNPGAVSQTAWLSARESGALGDLPYEHVLAIASLYEHQAGYHDLGDQMRNALMVDVARLGPQAAIGDRALNYITVDEDFAHREEALLRGYGEGIALLEGRRAAVDSASHP